MKQVYLRCHVHKTWISWSPSYLAVSAPSGSFFCYYHVRNCSTLVKGYYLDFYLQSSSFKELLLPPLYISSQMRPWQRIASTIHFPQSVWTKYGYSWLSALDVHSDTDIKIFMDVSSIPEPRLNQSSLFANRLSVLYLN